MANTSFDWHKHYHARALTSYASLEAADRGVAYTLLDLIYDAQGPLLRDDRLLGARMNMGRVKFTRTLERLIEMGKFYLTEDGRISNVNAENELDSVRNLAEIRKKAGKNGGKKKPKKPKKDNENNEGDDVLPKQNPKQNGSRDIRGGESKPLLGLRLPLFKREPDEDVARALDALRRQRGFAQEVAFLESIALDYVDGVWIVEGAYAFDRVKNQLGVPVREVAETIATE